MVVYAAEQAVAIAAVRRACTLTTAVFNNLVKGETLVKGDKSPVTVADLSAQAVVNTILLHAFPSDPIVGEEDAADLRENKVLCARVIELANEVLSVPPSELAEEKASWGLGEHRSEGEVLQAIDRGNYEGGRAGRMWTLDPIDGTKGFLRGGQYAVCLALINDGRVELGVIGCPNLPLDPAIPDGPAGALFVATRGRGAFQYPLSTVVGSKIPPVSLRMPSLPFENLSFLESVEKAHAALDTNAKIAQLLGVKCEPVRMDSQAKYAALARGDSSGGVYLRLPANTEYREKIWDHAPGSLLVEEAGGIISDAFGKPLDFGAGRFLGKHYGVVGAGKEIHQKLLEGVQQILKEEGKLA
ncbi:3',5'-bisphosphate nucleotidase [Vararia minispora EC-137]|uniref:3',5'-bisphosphate nucleotidase n=1 Tax=Vararia minispora EC-137 TaxID=1314806 RepID=A0ACB8QPN7_9AGAM|nr:3',5'-bisphosphate nucleotidase [Vararia minispora EC-137]